MIQLTVKKYNNFIDVFTGPGWENHTRFELQKKTLRFISGKTLTKEEFLNLKRELKHVSTIS